MNNKFFDYCIGADIIGQPVHAQHYLQTKQR